jgi:hypothetical protein
MKKLILSLSLIILTISCKPEPEVQTPQRKVEYVRINSLGKFPFNDKIDEITIQVIDECEYLVLNGYNNREAVITHKGNCKYCAERARATYVPSVTDTIK